MSETNGTAGAELGTTLADIATVGRRIVQDAEQLATLALRAVELGGGSVAFQGVVHAVDEVLGSIDEALDESRVQVKVADANSSPSGH